MYNIVVRTKYNVLFIAADDLEDPDLKEILTQQWVLDYTYWKVDDDIKNNGPFKKLTRSWDGDNNGKK